MWNPLPGLTLSWLSSPTHSNQSHLLGAVHYPSGLIFNSLTCMFINWLPCRHSELRLRNISTYGKWSLSLLNEILSIGFSAGENIWGQVLINLLLLSWPSYASLSEPECYWGCEWAEVISEFPVWWFLALFFPGPSILCSYRPSHRSQMG